MLILPRPEQEEFGISLKSAYFNNKLKFHTFDIIGHPVESQSVIIPFMTMKVNLTELYNTVSISYKKNIP